jgi:hypothetical protein
MARGCSVEDCGVTVERLERAIAVTAYCMAQHNLPQLMATLKRLEARQSDRQR